MTAVSPAEITDVLDRVRNWTPEMRAALAQRLLETIETPLISDPPRTMGLERVIGLLKTSDPPPDDEECRRIVEEERLRKHG